MRHDAEDDDNNDAESDTKMMSCELCKAMNSVYRNLRFTIETVEDFPYI